MKSILTFAKPISWLSLIIIIAAPILNYTGPISSTLMNQLLLAATIIWFISASLWIKPE
jgi:hypothetical protein